MKKLLLTLTAVAGLAFVSNAQDFGFQKTDFIVEGNFQAATSKDKNTGIKTSEFGFTPKLGYFVTDKIAVGVQFAFGQDKETLNDDFDKASAFGVGAFGRYYFLDLGSRFKTYTEVGVGYLSAKSENRIGGTTTKGPEASGLGANLGIGANYFLTERIAVNFAFADVLSFASAKVEGAESVSTFNANVNQFNNFFSNATFGLTFKF